MIEIVVNCNDNTFDIHDNITNERWGYHVIIPITLIMIMESIFNQMVKNMDEGFIGVKLIKIDEDTETTIGEW